MLRRNSFRAFLNTTSTMVSFLLSSVSKSLICRAATATETLRNRHCVIVSASSANTASYLLHEEVVHAPVVVGAGDDLQRVALPLGGLQGHAADLDAAPPLHLGRRLLVLLQLPEAPLQRQVRAAGGRQVLLACCQEGSGARKRRKRLDQSEGVGDEEEATRWRHPPSPSRGPVSPYSPSRESAPQISFSLDAFLSLYLVFPQKRILPRTLLQIRPEPDIQIGRSNTVAHAQRLE